MIRNKGNVLIDAPLSRAYNSDMDIELSKNAEYVINTLEARGETAYAVGGCVRDALRGIVPHDWDVCTSAEPETVMTVFSHTIPTGLKHGTVTVIAGDEPIEVTTFRTDGEYRDGRRPASVSFVSDVESDLARRDFTMNAMAWSPARGLCDPFGGANDLARGVIRAVGEPSRRFKEDALRILRALRFAAVCGFAIEENTARALHELRALAAHVAAERASGELCGMLAGEFAGRVAREFADVLAVWLPSVTPSALGALCRERSRDAVTRLALLTADADLPALRLDGCTADSIRRIRKLSETFDGNSAADVKRLIRDAGETDARRVMDMLEAEGRDMRAVREIYAAVLEERQCCSLAQLAADGRDMLSLGAEGREVGSLLGRLLDMVIDGRLKNEKNELLAAARLMTGAGGEGVEDIYAC